MEHWRLSPDLQRCKPWIEAALEYCNGTHEWEDIVRGIAKARCNYGQHPGGA